MYRTIFLDYVGEDEGGMIWENGIETCILSYVKRITSPGSMHDSSDILRSYIPETKQSQETR